MLMFGRDGDRNRKKGSKEYRTESQASPQRRHNVNVTVCLPGGSWSDTPTVLVHSQVGTGSSCPSGPWSQLKVSTQEGHERKPSLAHICYQWPGGESNKHITVSKSAPVWAGALFRMKLRVLLLISHVHLLRLFPLAHTGKLRPITWMEMWPRSHLHQATGTRLASLSHKPQEV